MKPKHQQIVAKQMLCAALYSVVMLVKNKTQKKTYTKQKTHTNTCVVMLTCSHWEPQW